MALGERIDLSILDRSCEAQLSPPVKRGSGNADVIARHFAIDHVMRAGGESPK